jgi:hypothetical protein
MLIYHCSPGFDFMVTSCIVCCHTTHTVDRFHILHLFLMHHNLYWGWFLCSFSCHRIFQFQLVLLVMPCSTVSFSASSVWSSVHFTVQSTCPPILKSPNHSRASSVRYWLYKLNRISDKQHPCLTPLPIFAFLVSLCGLVAF